MLFDSGQIDIFDLDNARHLIPEYTESDEWKDNIVSKITLGTSYLSINENIEPFDDVRVRKALQMAIDRIPSAKRCTKAQVKTPTVFIRRD